MLAPRLIHRPSSLAGAGAGSRLTTKMTDSSYCLMSPTSVLERDPKSPKGWRKRDSEGVGLGIVSALERECCRETIARLIVGNSKPGPAPAHHDHAIGCMEIESPETRSSWTVKIDSFRPSEFLNYCCLCRKPLHGKDIYMYRGEKGFCSVECRYQQIVADECHEKCWTEAAALEIPRYSSNRLFFTGITAA